MILNSWKAILYKKYTLKSKVYQMLLIGGVALFLALLSLIPLQWNESTPTQLSLTNLLAILVGFFTSCGLLNGQIELNYHESRQLSLLVGNKSKAIIYLMAVDLLDCFLQSFVTFGLLQLFYGLLHSGQVGAPLQLLAFILGANVFHFLAYFLTLCFKSTMTALGILVIFPLIVTPYLERMFPDVVPLLVYGAATDSLRSSVFGLAHGSLFLWLALVMVLTYLQFRKQV